MNKKKVIIFASILLFGFLLLSLFFGKDELSKGALSQEEDNKNSSKVTDVDIVESEESQVELTTEPNVVSQDEQTALREEQGISQLEDTSPEGDDVTIGDHEFEESDKNFLSNAKEIDLGYNLKDYQFVLLDANETHVLYLANPSVLILHDYRLNKSYELGTGVTHGSISDDGNFVVYYANSYLGSELSIFNVHKPNLTTINKFEDHLYHDVAMVNGFVYATYSDFDQTSFSIEGIPYYQGYPNMTDDQIFRHKIANTSSYMYLSKNNKLFFGIPEKNGIVEFTKDLETPIVSESPISSTSGVIIEDGKAFFVDNKILYIDNKPTEYQYVTSYTYLKGTLYFISNNSLYNYKDGNFTRLHTYSKGVYSSDNELILQTFDYKTFIISVD